ncbi:hypothetical protein DH2020_004587 [Rehmannia glutinosa]|uniref:Uncharacterized protein n=1 Tax=Rehmannia glutinosa TaxID=99300 RepID=A0ABR0XQ60_REHGL
MTSFRQTVRVQREEADLYAYEKTSLQSLKAFEWLSLDNSSFSDESPVSVVRVPQSYAPKSPTPSFLTSKDGTNKKKSAVEENQKNIRPSSAPRPRAVLSSPGLLLRLSSIFVNDGIIGNKTPTRGKLFTGLKNRPSQNRHTLCKIFPKSAAPESVAPTQGYNKESAEDKNDNRAKGRTALADTSIRAGHYKKIPSSVHS